ncbi:MAG: M23 family metallopeptidase [Muribaculaceae bacterium]|nr:M23 family metallopeptidase [Muribaculaceae bacterium]
MSQKKTFYRYNPVTESYERVYPSRSARLWGVARQFIAGMFTATLLFFGLYYVVEFPREKAMKNANDRLEQSLEMLERRSDEALAVMQHLQQRDNNFYRVMMQAEPLSDAARYAGLERQRNYESLDSLTDHELVRTVADKLDRLDNMVYNQIKSYDFLREQAAGLNERINNIPAIQPISSKYLKTMASGYGYRQDPIYGTTKFHEGMDFSSAIGTPVYATGAGIVKSAGWESGYGNSIDIDHGFNYLTRYAHLSQILVKPGQSVKRGDLIGKVGNTGKSTGSHLHYEVRYRGAPQNPVNYYFMDLTPEQYDEMILQAENAGHVMD